MKNEVLLQRKTMVAFEANHGSSPAPVVATVLKNLEALGYTLSKELMLELMASTPLHVQEFYKEVVPVLKEMRGAHKEWNPMYPNFPSQVMEAEESDLYFNAVMHYLGDAIGTRIMPEFEKDERFPLWEEGSLEVIKLASESDIHDMFKKIMASKTSISAKDKKHLVWYLQEYKEYAELPDKFEFKEIMTFTVASMLKLKIATADKLSKVFKTATDVLRLAVAMSDGDESLAEKTKFRNYKRAERRLLISLLNSAGNIEEDMCRHKTAWIRLGEKLHPGDYKAKFRKAYQAFDKIRNNKPIKKFSTRIEEALEAKNVPVAVELLKKRPGEFARRLDHITRMANTHESTMVIEAFKDIAEDIATPVLMQVMTHFKHRNDEKNMRVVFPKGTLGKAQAISPIVTKVSEKVCDRIRTICECALMKKFGEKEKLGRVFIDKTLKDILVPFSQRSASDTLKTWTRGSRIDLEEGEGDTIRFFLWWKDIARGNCVDIDLSAVFFDDDWNYKNHISYTNLRSAGYKACHSGDITSAPNGACEFIDIDMPSLAKHGGRYVMMQVYSFTRQKFTDMPECFAGWMRRKDVDSGEIFEAKTVQNKIDLTADTTVSIPVIIDVKEQKVIWCDLALKSEPRFGARVRTKSPAGRYGINTGGNNVETNLSKTQLMGKAMTEMVKPSLYDLFELHFEARGEELVDNKEDADTVFGVTEGDVTSFDIETIMADYL